MSADEPSAPVRITQREIYDLLVAIDKKLDPLPARIEDHETRLRALERQVWRWAGVAALVASVTATLIARSIPQ